MKKIMLLCGITLLTANVYASKSTDSDDQGELDLRHSMASTQLLDSSGDFSEEQVEGEEIDLRLRKRPPEKDEILFTIQNNTPRQIPFKLIGSINDQNIHPWKILDLRSDEWMVSPESSRNVMLSECELLGWHIKNFNQDIIKNSLPLNCEFIFSIAFGSLSLQTTEDGYNRYESQDYIANNQFKSPFPLGKTLYVHEIQYQSHKRELIKSFMVTFDDNPPVIESKEDLSDES